MSATAQAAAFGFVERLAKDLEDDRFELPAFPEAVLRVQRALQSADTSADDIVRILSTEPALAARLLRMANSVEFRLGRLYIIMRAQEMSDLGEEDLQEAVSDWHPTIGKAILESWGLPDAPQAAVGHQDEVEMEVEGPITLTDILISANLLAEGERSGGAVSASSYPALRRAGVSAGEKALEVRDDCVEEIQAIRALLGE